MTPWKKKTSTVNKEDVVNSYWTWCFIKYKAQVRAFDFIGETYDQLKNLHVHMFSCWWNEDTQF